jgi:hypothetical protein
LALIHPSAWNRNSRKFVCRILHKPAISRARIASPGLHSRGRAFTLLPRCMVMRRPAYASPRLVPCLPLAFGRLVLIDCDLGGHAANPERGSRKSDDPRPDGVSCFISRHRVDRTCGLQVGDQSIGVVA